MKRHWTRTTSRRNQVWSLTGIALALFCSAATVPVAEAQDTPPLYSTTPILETWDFELDMKPPKALDRARDALKEADLNLLTRTDTSDGGTSRFLYVIIHCRGCSGKTMGDVEVASYPGHDDERIKTGTFLRDYMLTGKKPPVTSSSNFAGEWKTTWLDMSLTQAGNRVTGTFAWADGKVEGTVTGNILRFHWTQSNGKGAGHLTLSEDGKSFKGFWSYTDDPDNQSGGTWDGTRK